ncbi:decarboxylase [Bacillus pseudomycoides]|uniref:Decarboxylase n=1 Tax=Bacillus pseudomycoides TaxID=64104 RepID=A0AA91VAR2_9BACI|nr:MULTISPECIES: helix-turn-helix domain-containing protein [Bacillus]PEB54196.1 decarboxylase [Bacillus sp. AFS098217]PED81546.1 decarboxylase [Bacillus pseudomycoides]PEU14134.1 decarboxylase [Bacillus sp. AFS014408]PEU17403.1 decarboxylase [Bacillus sp. AFS019443]PFW62989.1 decarboxylase [Bacillus sp. AFS075034]
MGTFYNLMKTYSEFQSKEEFNAYQQQIVKRYQSDINETDFLVIRLLGRYAVNEKQKTVGVACPLMGTIAEKIGKSIRTVRRSVAKLEELGIIERIPTKERHKRGGYSANLYVFRKAAIDRMNDRMEMTACEKRESVEGSKKEDAQEERETVYYKNFSKLQKNRITYELDETYCRHDIPINFIHAVIPMSRNPQTINLLWSKVELAYKKSGLLEQGVFLEKLIADEDVYAQVIRRTKSVVRAHKYGEIRKDIGALLYSTMRALFLDVGLEWGAAVRRSKGLTLFDPFKKESCV